MKTRVIQIASLTVFLAFTFAVFPADAQRRSSKNEVVKQRNEQKSDARKVKESKTTKYDASDTKKPQSSSSVRRTAPRGKQAGPAASKSAPGVNKRGNTAAQKKDVYKKESPQSNKRTATVQRRNPETNRSNISNAPARKQRETFRPKGSERKDPSHGGAVSTRTRTQHNRSLYRVDTKDSRYTPAKSFKGNKNHWKAGYAKHHVHYKMHNENYYSHYDYRRHLHWDHQWETYLWNVNSWRDYYSGYHPYSYRFHKHYFYHPGYGHVIKKFGYKPDYFVHNRMRYFNYNGHFFRHFPGVGYVLVDMPYGLVFNKLPRHAERVYINGFLYFRAGNLFFEKNPHGFALIHYPERYYALETDFYNGGYYREVDFYIYR